MSIEVIQYPLTSVWRGINSLWPTRIREYWKPSRKFFYLQKLPIPPGKFARGLSSHSHTLQQICHTVANNLLTPVTNLPEGCQQCIAHLQEGCPNYIQKGNLYSIPLNKVKFNVKNQEATDSYKNYRRFISK
jgi:hypothetical protein